MKNHIDEFIHQFNAQTTECRLRLNHKIIDLFLGENSQHINNLSYPKHRDLILEWILDSKDRIKGKNDVYDYYIYIPEVMQKNPKDFGDKINKVTILLFDKPNNTKVVSNKRFEVNYFWGKHDWRPLCLADNDEIVYLRDKFRKRYIYSNLAVSDFTSLDLPLRGIPLEIWSLTKIKKEVLRFISRYGCPFGEYNYKEFLEKYSNNSFFYYFVHKWLRVMDLLILKKNYPSFPRINTEYINLDLVKFPISHYIELIDEANKSIKQISGRRINNSKFLYDCFTDIYGLILNTILFPTNGMWKQCQYKKCNKWFIPFGKKKRGCCEAHQQAIRTSIYRKKHLLTSEM